MLNLWKDYIKYCLDDKSPLPDHINSINWDYMFRFCQEQAIAGVLYNEDKWKISEVTPQKEVMLQWFVLSEQIKHHNILLNKRCVELVELLKKDGFRKRSISRVGKPI